MAYNRYYQYETSPRKLKPEYEPIKKIYPKKSTARKINKQKDTRKNKILQIKIMSYIAICFIALFVISYRYAMIDNIHVDLKEQEAKLKALEKETTQLEANIESSLNLTRIEEEAKELLGMQKLSSEQIVYVTLPKMDHVETSSEEVKSSDLEGNWFLQLIDKIVQSFQ